MTFPQMVGGSTVSRRYLRPSRDIFGRVREGQEGRYGAERALSSARRGEEAVGPPWPVVVGL